MNGMKFAKVAKSRVVGLLDSLIFCWSLMPTEGGRAGNCTSKALPVVPEDVTYLALWGCAMC